VPRDNYRVGVPHAGRYVEKLSSDDLRFGGSEYERPPSSKADPIAAHGRQQSVKLQLPPLGCLFGANALRRAAVLTRAPACFVGSGAACPAPKCPRRRRSFPHF